MLKKLKALWDFIVNCAAYAAQEARLWIERGLIALAAWVHPKGCESIAFFTQDLQKRKELWGFVVSKGWMQE